MSAGAASPGSRPCQGQSIAHPLALQRLLECRSTPSAPATGTHSWLEVLKAFSAERRLVMVPFTATALTV